MFQLKRLTQNYSFIWEGLNKNNKIVQGKIISSSIFNAKKELKKQGIARIKKISKNNHYSSGFYYKKITSSQMTVFARELATLIAAGVPLIPSLNAIYRGSNNVNFKNLLSLIRADLESGQSLAESFAKHPKYFNDLFISLIDAGEMSGSLDTMLEKLALYKENVDSIKGKIKKALVYPITIFVVTIVITAGLLIFIVPQFESLFKNFGNQLPFITQVVINISYFIQQFWWLIGLFVTASIYSFIKAKSKYASFHERIDKLIINVPVFGPLIKNAAISRFARTLSITFAAGLPLVDALKSVASTSDNIIIAKAILTACDDVAKGIELQTALSKTGIFPQMPLQMIAIGEKSGKLELMLAKVASYYEEQVDNSVSSLSTLIEPFTMIFLGLLIGTIVIAMYLPIFNLGSVV